MTWLQRELIPGLPTFEGFLRKPVVLDVDDAVWLLPPLGRLALSRIARRASIVVAGNNFLADWFAKYCANVQVIPTSIDTDQFVPRSRTPPGGSFTIGWTGSATNLPFLYSIEAPLASFLGQRPEARLLIVADEKPNLSKIAPGQTEFVRWSEESEVRAVQQMDVGLMPLPDTDWCRGKCGFKLLQYLACGVPVVASPVGMNREILELGSVGFEASEDSHWFDALENLGARPTVRRSLGREGRDLVEAKFCKSEATRRLAEIFHGIQAQ